MHDDRVGPEVNDLPTRTGASRAGLDLDAGIEQKSPRTPPRWMRALARPVGGRPALLLELFIFWMFFQYFNYAQEHIRGEHAESVRHALRLFSIEENLHLDMERHLNSVLAAVPWLAKLAGYYYGMVLATVPIALAWCWWMNPTGFRRLRRLLVATTLPSLLVFWLLPMAPPRFAVHGIVDINALYNILGGALARDPSRSANLYAALPSLHCAWSTWVAYVVFDTLRHRRPLWAYAAWLYPTMTALDVMATGNHFFLDVVAGVGLFLFGLLWVRVMRGAEERIWDERGTASSATAAAS